MLTSSMTMCKVWDSFLFLRVSMAFFSSKPMPWKRLNKVSTEGSQVVDMFSVEECFGTEDDNDEPDMPWFFFCGLRRKGLLRP
jgi:hypothetical protein